MLIISNCLTDTVDEGALKVANSLVKRIKARAQNVHVASYERSSSVTDSYFEVNKFLLNKDLISLIKKQDDKVLYLPFPARALPTALRIFMLSLFSKKRLSAVLVMSESMSFSAKLLLKLSKANIIVLSKETYDYYTRFLSVKKVKHLKCGIDTKRFLPVDSKTQRALKEKYGFAPDIPLVLHVGHLKEGRNIGALTLIDKKYQVLLVTSTLTKNEQDAKLKKRVLQCENIRIIEDYIDRIEEVYQMSDVYLFPVVAQGNCIDIPLSCMEAASCNIPVITTRYGEMKEFEGKEDFYFVDSFDEPSLNSLISIAVNEKRQNSRDSVVEYDWDNAVEDLLESLF